MQKLSAWLDEDPMTSIEYEITTTFNRARTIHQPDLQEQPYYFMLPGPYMQSLKDNNT